MKSKVQAQMRTADQLASERATQIFGLAMTSIFVAMLLLTAISY